jgi:hypothetical protein
VKTSKAEAADAAEPLPAAVRGVSKMPATQVTKSSTEADLETRIDAAIRMVFPFLTRNAITHQTTFSFSFGGKKITVDGKSKYSVRARADIILSFENKPLAVLELKRSGLVLSDEDSNQGLSYARVLNPSPPLVVVSNGQEVRFIETHTGQEWHPKERSGKMLAGLVQAAARVADNDLKAAVGTLMATSPEVWIQAVRQTTTAGIAELSGGWNDRLLPFVNGFQLPRKATKDVSALLQGGSKLVIVEGTPLSGKSNILRELAQDSEKDTDLVVLFIESGGATKVLQQVADTLAQELDWPVSKEEARTWLKNLSNTEGPKLVVAIDGIGLNLAESRDEIVDLTSLAFGPRLAFVIELDNTNAEMAVLNSTGRKASAIGRRAGRVRVMPLDDYEFKSACVSLWNHRIGVTAGAQLSPELRLPWVLRAIGSHFVSQPKHSDPNLAGMIPPLLSVELISLTRGAFPDEMRTIFQAIATAVLEDAEDAKRPITLMLESAGTYVVQKKTLKKQFSESELRRIVEQGLLRPILHESGEPLLVANIPELVASEASVVLARQLRQRALQSSKKAARWLSMLAANLPLGDVLVAHAFVDAAIQDQSLPFDVITALMEHPPRKEIIKEGSRLTMHLPDSGTLHLTARTNGFSVSPAYGGNHFICFDPEDAPAVTYADIHAWLILSHLAGIPLAIVKREDNVAIQRVDPAILMVVGKCPIVLRRPNFDPNMSTILTHDFEDHGSFVCHKAGIVEPITLSIFRFLCSEGENAAEWIQKAAASGSLPLLARVDIALIELSSLAEAKNSTFAKEARDKWISPAMSTLLPLH